MNINDLLKKDEGDIIKKSGVEFKEGEVYLACFKSLFTLGALESKFGVAENMVLGLSVYPDDGVNKQPYSQYQYVKPSSSKKSNYARMIASLQASVIGKPKVTKGLLGFFGLWFGLSFKVNKETGRATWLNQDHCGIVKPVKMNDAGDAVSLVQKSLTPDADIEFFDFYESDDDTFIKQVGDIPMEFIIKDIMSATGFSELSSAKQMSCKQKLLEFNNK